VGILKRELQRRIQTDENRLDAPRDWTPSPFNRTEPDRSERVFRNSLIRTLEDDPIEDGVPHPAEGLIDKAMTVNVTACLDWLARAFTEYSSARPATCAALVRCIGRIKYDRVGSWGLGIARVAIKHIDIEVRESAVRALEAWEAPMSLSILRSHTEPDGWLADYIRRVIADMSS